LTPFFFVIMQSEEIAVGQRRSNRDEGDEDRLAQFGYKQELKRDWGLAHNFGVSFSIIVSKQELHFGKIGRELTNRALLRVSLPSSHMD
jgi:hypothetical protein